MNIDLHWWKLGSWITHFMGWIWDVPPTDSFRKETIPKERWWQDLPRWVEDGAPQLRGTVVGLIKNWGIAWDIPNLMVVSCENHFFPPIFVAAGKIWSADKREPIWENVKPWSPLIDALLRAWCQTHTSSDCQPCQVEDTLGNGMILDLLKEVDGNGDGVIDFQAVLQSCSVCRGTTWIFVRHIYSIYVNHFESVDLFASDPGIFSSKSQNQMPLLPVLWRSPAPGVPSDDAGRKGPDRRQCPLRLGSEFRELGSPI